MFQTGREPHPGVHYVYTSTTGEHEADIAFLDHGQRWPWGPFDWKQLRECLALKWLSQETMLADARDGPWEPAQSIEKLWKGTKALAKRIYEFEIANFALEKVPLTSALRKRITDLGWPGNVELLRNYYWGDHLRTTLEELLADPTRPAFDDPDRPKRSPVGFHGGSASGSAEPITPNQGEALTFFLGKDHGIQTKGEASEKLGELLDDSDNEVRWEEQRSKVPATERQRDRLKWLANQVGVPMPSPLNKAQASRLIDEWLEEHPELEEECGQRQLFLPTR